MVQGWKGQGLIKSVSRPQIPVQGAIVHRFQDTVPVDPFQTFKIRQRLKFTVLFDLDLVDPRRARVSTGADLL